MNPRSGIPGRGFATFRRAKSPYFKGIRGRRGGGVLSGTLRSGPRRGENEAGTLSTLRFTGPLLNTLWRLAAQALRRDGKSGPGTPGQPLSVRVTGAAGFIGQHVVRHLAGLGRRLAARQPVTILGNGTRQKCKARLAPFTGFGWGWGDPGTWAGS